MDAHRCKALSDFYRDGLLLDTLPFWTRYAPDRKYGGFFTALDADGKVVDTDKSVWHQGRFTWLLAELYNEVEPREEWLALALTGAEFLEQHCFDRTDGRMWFHVTEDGRPIRKRRYSYSESFAAIAFGELYKATGEERFAQLAESTFQQFVDHQSEPNPSNAKFTSTRTTRDLGFPMITIVTAQELRGSMKLATADHWIDASISSIRKYHLNSDMQCVLECVGNDGEFIDHFDGRTLNPGHAIEASWFLMREGVHRNDEELIAMGCQMLDWMWQRGWDDQYGGLLYFVDASGLTPQEYWHDMKFWWPHNEAIIATLMAWTLTGRSQYAEWHQQVHDWAFEHFPDHTHGEWYGYLHRDGSLSSPLKGNLWKGPFHLPRMQLTCWKLLEKHLSNQNTNS